MKFYFTIEPCGKLKNMFTNLSSFYIIDVDTILSESGLDPDKPSHRFLINSELCRLINSGAKSKRYIGMIYINSRMNCDVISSIKRSIGNLTNSVVDGFVILDDESVPKLKDYYELSDEVSFFPTMKRTRLIECAPIVIPKINEIENAKNAKKALSLNIQEEQG